MKLKTPGRHRYHVVVRRLPGLALLASLVMVGACDEPPSAPPSGSLQVLISGLPPGEPGIVRISGPRGYVRILNHSQLLGSLHEGEYLVEAEKVTPLEVFAPTQSSQLVMVGGDEPAAALVRYQQITGSLRVDIAGLPASGSVPVTVTGPNDFEREVMAPRTLHALEPGQYRVTPGAASAGGCNFQPLSASISAIVSAGPPTRVEINYTANSEGGESICIESVYLVQAVQRRDGGVPLVAGRDALIRVFLRGDGSSGSPLPTVRVRFYDGTGSDPVHTVNIQPPGSVPLVPDEGSLSSTWNALIPGSVIRSGLSVLVDAELESQGSFAGAASISYPVNGEPLALSVAALPTLRVRFIPVIQQREGTTGRVDEANVAQFISLTRTMAPVGAIEYTIGTPLVWDGEPIQSNNANGAWGSILQSLDLKRREQSSVPGEHYYGVIQPAYSAGVAGIAYLPGLSALGWDHLPTGAIVAAHELGHNWGRLHTPGCQNPGIIDYDYPHPGGDIGAYGYDVVNSVLYPPVAKDIMSYCSSPWISDYTYEGILANRVSSGGAGASVSTNRKDVLIVWGRIVDGRMVLEPTFIMQARPSLPSRGGRYRIEGRDATGVSLFSLSFDPVEIADLPGPEERHFSFAIPVSAATRQRLESIRVSGAGLEARRAFATAAAPEVTIGRDARGRLALNWDRTQHEAVLVRDGRTGDILSIARSGSVSLFTDASEVELVPSDAPGAASRRISVPHMR